MMRSAFLLALVLSPIGASYANEDVGFPVPTPAPTSSGTLYDMQNPPMAFALPRAQGQDGRLFARQVRKWFLLEY